MTQLDFIPRTQRECALVETMVRSEFGFTPTMQARVVGVRRLRAWMDRRQAVESRADLVVIGGAF